MTESSTPRRRPGRLLSRLYAWEERVRDWIDRWGYGAGSRQDRPRLSEVQVLRALAAGSYAIRMGLAVLLFALWQVWILRPAVIRGQPYSEYAVVLLLLMGVTIAHYASGVLLHFRRGRLPSTLALSIGASLDVLWIIAGYVVSGFSAVPFPPLLILAIGFHSLFLGVLGAAWIACLGSGLFFMTSLLGNFERNPVFSSATQAAFVIGVGALGALLGNRIRAAVSTVRILQETVDRLAGHQREVMEGLPVGSLVLSSPKGEPEVNLYTRNLLRMPEAPASEVLERLSASLPGLAAAIQAGFQERVIPDEPCGSGEGEIETEEEEPRWVTWVAVPRNIPDPGYRPSALAAPPLLGSWSVSDSAPPLPMIRSVTVLVTDLTDQRRSEAMKRQAERFAAVAELSAGLAHEVRNPLAALRSSAEQLSEEVSLDETDRRLLGIVIRESDRLNRLVSEFLDFARVGGGVPARVDLERLVSDAVSLALRGGGKSSVRVEVVDLPAVAIEADPDLVYRVLSNLLLNAVQFSPEGGVVRVEGQALENGRGVRIAVTDQGPGVPEKLRERIFSPFVTTRQGGTGLGLAIAQRAATLLGGGLNLEPAGERGAKFVFFLPSRASSSRFLS